MSILDRSGPPASSSARRARPLAGLAVLAALALALGACASGAGTSTEQGAGAGGAAPSAGTSTSTESPSESAVPVVVKANVRKGAAGVPVDKVVTVTAAHGRLKEVTVSAPKTGKVAGSVSSDGSTWTAADLLEPGSTYTVETVAVNADGTASTTRSRFSTADLTLDQQTYPSVAPLNGETVGVGMPVIVTFDVPVTDKASFEKHMHVDSTPAQPGSWHWISDTEAHWRPKSYWKAGTKVSVHVDVNSVPAGHGIYGQEDRDVAFKVGDAHIYKINIKTDQMKVLSNGKLLRTVPVTTGMPGFTTRSGVKVIVEKYPSKEMNSETIGIDPNSANGYDINNVQWAMRLTYSGEFLHAAPWSVASQGVANVSHGCTGMSTANADWLYHMSRRGDVVETTGSDKYMTLDNGYGDWNESFKDYKKGSALH